MNTLPPISLDDAWLCTYFERDPNRYESTGSEAISSLEHWSSNKQHIEHKVAWLHRQFTLSPTDSCINYWLFIDSAPLGAQIYINDQLIAQYTIGDDDPPFEIDVTDFVWLEGNTIAIRFDIEGLGTFSGVRLQPILCE